MFAQDSVPVCRALPSPRSKLHQIKYINLDPSSDDGDELLAASTEDGRIIFYSTKKLRKAEDDEESSIPYAEAVAQLGGKQSGLPGRVKDFEILSLRDELKTNKNDFLVVTGSSDGTVRVWLLGGKDLKETTDSKSGNGSNTRQVGKLLNTYETGNRITCLKAFVMLPPEDASALGESEDESEEEEPEESSGEVTDDSE